MFHEITVDEKIENIVDDWDFFADKIVGKFAGFRTLGQNIYGIRRRVITRTTITDPRKGDVSGALEMGPDGIRLMPHVPLHVHVTAGGTPHRVANSFGFWHVNDMDELYLPLPNPPGDDFGHMLVIMQTPTGNEGESFAWYCQKCLTLHHEYHYRSGEFGLQGFWKAEENAVRGYNSDERNRTCPECGFLNPMAYCWNSAKDTPGEREARAIW